MFSVSEAELGDSEGKLEKERADYLRRKVRSAEGRRSAKVTVKYIQLKKSIIIYGVYMIRIAQYIRIYFNTGSVSFDNQIYFHTFDRLFC